MPLTWENTSVSCHRVSGLAALSRPVRCQHGVTAVGLVGGTASARPVSVPAVIVGVNAGRLRPLIDASPPRTEGRPSLDQSSPQTSQGPAVIAAAKARGRTSALPRRHVGSATKSLQEKGCTEQRNYNDRGVEVIHSGPALERLPLRATRHSQEPEGRRPKVPPLLASPPAPSENSHDNNRRNCGVQRRLVVEAPPARLDGDCSYSCRPRNGAQQQHASRGIGPAPVVIAPSQAELTPVLDKRTNLANEGNGTKTLLRYRSSR